MKEPVSVRELTESSYPAWRELVAESPEGSPYSTPEYLSALCEATGARFRILAACRGDELLGGVALYEEQGWGGVSVSPRLLLHYNGLVLRRSDTKYPSLRTARQLETLAALRVALEARGYRSLRLKCRHALRDVRVFVEAGWTVRPAYTYLVSLDDPDRLLGRMEQNLRRLVERCGRQGIVVAEDEDFASFFRMHRETLGRKGAAIYLPEAPFTRYYRRLHGAGLMRVYHARLPGGETVGAQLVLADRHPVAHTVGAASDPSHLKLGATAYLRYKVFEDLARRGYQANDLTDAALNAVTHFKAQLGGDLELCLSLEAPKAPRARLHQVSAALHRLAGRVLGAFARREPHP